MAVGGRITAYGVASGAITGSGSANQIAYFTGAGTIAGSSDLTLTVGAAAGSSNFVKILNSNNTNTASHAYLEAAVGGTAGGSPHTRYTITGGTSWGSGPDNTDADTYKIFTGTNPAASLKLAVSTTGFLYVAGLGALWNQAGTAGGVVAHTCGASTGYVAITGGTSAASGTTRIEIYGSGHVGSPNDYRLYNGSGHLVYTYDATADAHQWKTNNTVGLVISSAQLVTIGTGTSTVHRVNAQLGTNASGICTVANGPTGTSGDPAVWWRVNINGTDRAIPAWSIT